MVHEMGQDVFRSATTRSSVTVETTPLWHAYDWQETKLTHTATSLLRVSVTRMQLTNMVNHTRINLGNWAYLCVTSKYPTQVNAVLFLPKSPTSLQHHVDIFPCTGLGGFHLPSCLECQRKIHISWAHSTFIAHYLPRDSPGRQGLCRPAHFRTGQERRVTCDF